MKSFCINEACKDFLPEDKRGYYKKTEKTEKTTKKTTKKTGSKSK